MDISPPMCARAITSIKQDGFWQSNIPAWDDRRIAAGLRTFMSADEAYKRTYLQRHYGYAFDGYSYIGQEDSSNQGATDLVSSFVLSTFHGKEAFPAAFHAFWETEWERLVAQVRALEAGLLQELGEEGLLACHQHQMGYMISCNYYPSKGSITSPGDQAVRLTAHNDISLFTVFPFGLAAGLAWQCPDGSWCEVPATDCWLVFSGYFLEKWTLGTISAFHHRVSLPQSQFADRVSFAIFSLPKPNQQLTMADGSKVSSEQYFRMYLAQFD